MATLKLLHFPKMHCCTRFNKLRERNILKKLETIRTIPTKKIFAKLKLITFNLNQVHLYKIRICHYNLNLFLMCVLCVPNLMLCQKGKYSPFMGIWLEVPLKNSIV